MARTARRKFDIDLRPAIEYIGLKSFLEQVGVKRILAYIASDPTLVRLAVRALVERFGLDGILAAMSPAQRRELKRRLNEKRRGLRSGRAARSGDRATMG